MSGQSKVIEKTALCIKIQILQSFWKISMLFFIFHYFLCFLQSICLQAAIAVNKKIWIKIAHSLVSSKVKTAFVFFFKWFPYFFVSQYHVLRIFRYSSYILEKKKKQQIGEDSLHFKKIYLIMWRTYEKGFSLFFISYYFDI